MSSELNPLEGNPGLPGDVEQQCFLRANAGYMLRPLVRILQYGTLVFKCAHDTTIICKQDCKQEDISRNVN